MHSLTLYYSFMFINTMIMTLHVSFHFRCNLDIKNKIKDNHNKKLCYMHATFRCAWIFQIKAWPFCMIYPKCYKCDNVPRWQLNDSSERLDVRQTWQRPWKRCPSCIESSSGLIHVMGLCLLHDLHLRA